MNRKSFFVGSLAAGCFTVSLMLMPIAASAQADPKVAKAMELLKTKTAKLGAPRIEGKDAVEGKDVPALYFGTTKMNNNFTVVDEVGAAKSRSVVIARIVNAIARTIPTVNRNLAGFGFGAMYPSWRPDGCRYGKV